MEIDKKTAKALTDEITASVDEILARHGLTRSKTSSKYGDLYSVTISADVLSVGVNGVNTTSKAARDYERYAASYGLPQGLLGKTFRVNGSEYAFAGIAVQRPKYPIYVRNVETGAMSFFQEGVKRFLVDSSVKI